ncbi:MAG: T9SS type A sorting domain-containing protein, partial [Bacteroidales bacterium]
TNNGDITGTGVVHYQSDDPQVVAPGNYPTLVLDNPGGLVLNGEVFVETELVLAEGALVIGEHNLVLGPDAYVTELKAPVTWIDATGSGMVVKEFSEPGSFTFPVGNFGVTPAYTPVELVIGTGIFYEGWVGVRLAAEKHPDNTRGPNALNRYWVVESGGITDLTYSAIFNYVDTDVDGDDALIDGVKSNDGTPPPVWWRLSRCVAVDNYFEATDQSSFSVFTGVEYYKPPVAVITSPADGANVYETPFTIEGTASDEDDDLDDIYYRLNGGDWLLASGTASWSKSVDLKLWENVLEVKAADVQDLESEIVKHTFNLSIQNLEIPAGWSYISGFLNPNDPDVVNIMQALTQENLLQVMLGADGIYAPAPFNINTLGTWDVHQGYKVKLNGTGELTIGGDAPESNSVEFPAGLHIIPVLTNTPVALTDVFTDPENQIMYMLDIYSNQVYWPQGGINTLSQLQPGVGYLTNFAAVATANYPPLDDYYFPADNDRPSAPAPGPWDCIRTADVHLISVEQEAVLQLDNVDYIGAFDASNNCIGYLQVDARSGNFLLTIYGDDPYTTAKDGALAGEAMILRGYNGSTGEEYLLAPTYSLAYPNYDGAYVSNGLSGIESLKQSATGIVDQSLEAGLAIYPNPAKDQVFIELNNSEYSSIRMVLTNAAGYEVMVKEIDQLRTRIDVSGMTSGVYVVKIESGNEIVYRKLVIH